MYLDEVINNFFYFSISIKDELTDLLKELENVVESEKVFIDTKDFKKKKNLNLKKD